MQVLTFPSNVALDIVIQEFVPQVSDFRGIRDIAPLIEFMSQKVRWDESLVVRGMTAPHGMDSDPKIGKRQGVITREYEPIPFKETDPIHESEILKSRELGTLGGVVSLDYLVSKTARERTIKTFTRAEWCIWQMLRGSMSIDENGVKVTETFPVQTFNSTVAWSAHATATPLADLQAVALLYRGTGASANGARAWLNQTTLNHLLSNRNENDLWGMRGTNFVSLTFSIEQANSILKARGLPMLDLYDEGYVDDNGLFQTFIPDNVVVVEGKRPAGQVVANFGMTPHIHRTKNGQEAPGFFSIVEVNGQPAATTSVSVQQLGSAKNPRIDVTGGVYGGPVLWYPRTIVSMDVS